MLNRILMRSIGILGKKFKTRIVITHAYLLTWDKNTMNKRSQEQKKPKHSNLFWVSVKFTRKAKCSYVISFLIEDRQGIKIATL